MQLLPRERQPREQRVLLEEKIADGEPGEEIHLRELAQLADPLEQEKKLRRQREARQERILLGVLEDQARPQPSGETPGEAGLADADRPFDDDVVIFGKRHGGLATNGAHHTQHARGRYTPAFRWFQLVVRSYPLASRPASGYIHSGQRIPGGSGTLGR